MKIEMSPIGFIENSIDQIADDQWKDVVSTIQLTEEMHEHALRGLEAFSHVIVIFYMHQVPDEKAISQHRHPRNNAKLPKLGTFAQRNKSRPNKIGLTTAKVVSVSGKKLQVLELDAISGTPVLDIKPVMRSFEARGAIVEPDWVTEIMGKYWK